MVKYLHVKHQSTSKVPNECAVYGAYTVYSEHVDMTEQFPLSLSIVLHVWVQIYPPRALALCRKDTQIHSVMFGLGFDCLFAIMLYMNHENSIQVNKYAFGSHS